MGSSGSLKDEDPCNACILPDNLKSKNEEKSEDPCNALVLPGNHKSKNKDKKQVGKDRKQNLSCLSKNKQRKLRRLQEEKDKRAMRSHALDTLEKYKLREDAHALLNSSANIGQVETMREKLCRAMRFHRAGLAVPADIPLFREKTIDCPSLESENADHPSLERENCTSKLLALKQNMKKDMQETGQMQTRKRKQVALHTCVSASLSEVVSNLDGVYGDEGRVASTDNKGKETKILASQALHIGRNDMSMENDVGSSLYLSQARYRNGVKPEILLSSAEQDLDATKASPSGSHEDKNLTCPPPLGSGDIGDSASIKCQHNSEHNAGETQFVNTLEEGKYQVSRGESVKLDKQNNASSGASGVAPVTNNFVVYVSRPQEIEKIREKLPIVMMEQEIMEAISDHLVVIICGETGCGKTTQVPQFLFEAGFGSRECKARAGIIGITQPRRVAVLATAKRVAHELSLQLGKEVGLQVRHDRRIGESSSIKFMTDGILLREVQSDFLLRRYSIIVLDEAHERSLNTDILIGMLSRIVPLRQSLYEEQQRKMQHGETINLENRVTPLKLVLMSATLRIEDFVSNSRLFPAQPPVVEVPTRQFPVTIHFSAKTELVDYLEKAYKKVLAIHKKLPAGGILVFVTGQREVEFLCRKLRKAFLKRNINSTKTEGAPKITNLSADVNNGSNVHDLEGIIQAVDPTDDNRQLSGRTDRFNSYDDDEGFDADGEENLESSDTEFDVGSDSEEEECRGSESVHDDEIVQQNSFLGKPGCLASLKAAFEALSGDGKNVKFNTNLFEQITTNVEDEEKPCLSKEDSKASLRDPGPLHVLPLYAMLPAAAQLRVFGGVPEGERLVVVATNVAETSLTIPGIKYVVDCGRAKVKEYNCSSGMARYEIQWISKASAAQRAGRAGRTGPGHCYRLYSSAVFNNSFPNFAVPEISKAPIEGIVLLMKYMGINKVVNFPFPTPPDGTALAEAERCLKALAALDHSTGKLTPIGEAMVLYPISPRHSRMLLTVIQTIKNWKECSMANLVLAFATAVAAALSMDSPFLTEFGLDPGEDASVSDIDRPLADDSASLNGSLDGKKKDRGIVPVAEKETEEPEKLRMKQHRAMASAAHNKFQNMSSDALTVANALRSFEIASDPGQFCRRNSLHLKTMDEMSKLRKQLLHLIFNQKLENKLKDDFSWSFGNLADVELAWRDSTTNFLTSTQEDLLGQAICAGWADRIARRLRPHRTVKASAESPKTKATRYQACSVEEDVFLHRASSVARLAPEFVVYNELIYTRRPYMHGVTSVKSNWLVLHASALCTFSRPLADPQPYYDSASDQVFCWVSPTFGPHLWELPLHNTPMKSGKHRTAVFACAFLQGKVLPCLKTTQNFLAANPSIMLKPEAAAHKRVSDLLYRLSMGPVAIDSRGKLNSAWNADPKYLYFEILSWFQSKFHQHFEELWERMKHEARLDYKQLFPDRKKKGSNVKHRLKQ